MDKATFEYLMPSDMQIAMMSAVRNAAADFQRVIDRNVPDGPDKTYLVRKFREVAMWANVAITRQPNGAPRTDE